MLKIGIIFCGGCQTRYDRAQAYHYLKQNVNVAFEYAKKDYLYECIVVINGCLNSCANLTDYQYHKILKINKLEDIDEIINELKNNLL